jgi:hypothetical protein
MFAVRAKRKKQWISLSPDCIPKRCLSALQVAFFGSFKYSQIIKGEGAELFCKNIWKFGNKFLPLHHLQPHNENLPMAQA